MSTILGADGRPPEKEEPTKPGSNGRGNSELRDVRTVPMGALLYNFSLCVVDMHINKITLMQMQMAMQQQKMVVEPPEIVQIKAAIQQATGFRDAMMGEINTRFKDVDEARLAGLNMEVTDLTAPQIEPAPV